MPVIYDGNAIIPGPFVSISQSERRSDDGTLLGHTNTIRLVGKVVAYKGSPNSSGGFWTLGGEPPDEVLTSDERLKAIVRKINALKGMLRDGAELNIVSWDGYSVAKFYTKVVDFDAPEDLWYNTADYVITLQEEKSNLQINGDDVYIDSMSEQWSFEENPDDRQDPFGQEIVYVATHTVSAHGVQAYDETGASLGAGWEQAKKFVDSKIDNAIDSTMSRYDLSGYQQYNYLLSNQVDEYGGAYSATEIWTLAKGKVYREESNITCRINALEATNSIVVEGTIIGYEGDSGRWDNALTGWEEVEPEILTRALSYSVEGVGTLNPIELNKVVGKNPTRGTITYSYEYDTRLPVTIPNALSESFTVTDTGQKDVFASILVLGRTLGPVLQDIGTKTAKQRTLSIDVLMPVSGVAGIGYLAGYNLKPNTNTVKAALQPIGTTKLFLDQDDESWNWRTGVYNRLVQWTFEKEDD